MNSVKIMHIADYHIGYEYSFLENASEKRKLEVLRSLEKLCEYSNKKQIDIVLIAGDFIEASTISSAYINEIKKILSNFEAGIFIVAGNHDYISVGSYYLDDDWPDNVHIFKDNNLEQIYLDDLNLCIYGASFTSSYQRQSLLTEDIVIEDKYINIGLLHGDAIFKSDDLYNPISKEQIKRIGFDYLALGHIHKKTGILNEGKSYYAYPGSAVSLGFSELATREVIIAEIGKDNKFFDVLPLEIGQFLEKDFKLSDVDDERKLANKIIQNLRQEYENFQNNYYKINLVGDVEEHYSIDLNLLKSMLSDLTFVKLEDKTRIKIDYDLLMDENSLKGTFVKNILNEQKEAQMREDFEGLEILEEALNITIKAFEGNL